MNSRVSGQCSRAILRNKWYQKDNTFVQKLTADQQSTLNKQWDIWTQSDCFSLHLSSYRYNLDLFTIEKSLIVGPKSRLIWWNLFSIFVGNCQSFTYHSPYNAFTSGYNGSCPGHVVHQRQLTKTTCVVILAHWFIIHKDIICTTENRQTWNQLNSVKTRLLYDCRNYSKHKTTQQGFSCFCSLDCVFVFSFLLISQNQSNNKSNTLSSYTCNFFCAFVWFYSWSMFHCRHAKFTFSHFNNR